MSPNRYTNLDAVSGLMIIFMVIFHIAGQYGRIDLYTSWGFRPFFFFMFWFFFKGGLVFKPRKISDIIRSGLRRLVVPALIWLFIGCFLYEAVSLYIGRESGISGELFQTFIHEGSVDYHLPVWFLFSLFFVRLIYSSIAVRSKTVRIMVSLSSICVTAVISGLSFDVPFYFYNILLGLSFFILGDLLKDGLYMRGPLVVAVSVYVTILLICPSSLDFRTNRLIEGHYMPCLLSALSGCVLFGNIFRFWPVKALEYVGRNSLVWLLVHWPVKYLGGILLGQFPESGFLMNSILLLVLVWMSSELVAIFVSRYHLCFMIGNRLEVPN